MLIMLKQNKSTIIVQEIDDQAARQAEQAAYEERMGKLQSLGTMLSKKRDEAIEARRISGIEEDWIEDEEHYEGIDDANRELYRNRAKPLSPEGGSDKDKEKTVRSRVFLNITRPYVDAAAAKVADMLLPTDDQNWGIEPTPIPTLTKNKDSKAPLIMPDGQPVVSAGEGGQQKQMTVGEHAKMILDMAVTASKEAETRIDDWLTESNYNHETRKVIENCARLGTGVVKGPYPVMRTQSSISKEGGLTSVKRNMKIFPESRSIDPWDLYPDAACGNNVHNGSYVFEKDRLTKRSLEELARDDTYIADMIAVCLAEGPQKKYLEDKEAQRQSLNLDSKDQYEVWYYTGFISPDDMEAAGCPCGEGQESVPAIVVMINDHVVKAAVNPLDSGAFPYDVMNWQERDGYWAGIGVSRQIRTPQRILNAGVRNVMDNAGLMSGPQIVMRRGVIEPADGVWQITPRKLWYMLEDATGPVSEAFAAINIPAMQEQLFSIIQFAIKMAEDVTGLPALLQGQQGAAPETVGGMQMLNNNASTVMRRIARTYDDKITEPHIRRYYEWLILDPDVPESEKGDYKIVARGSSALVERDIQNQTIAQMGAMVVNPAFGIDPKRWIAEYFKSQRLNPTLFMYTEDELAKLAEQQAQNPPQDPRQITAQATVEATKIRTDGMVAVSHANVQEKQTQRDIDLQDAREQRQHEAQLATMAYQTKVMEMAEKRNLSIEQIKAQLAGTAMVEKNKRDMQSAEVKVKESMGSGL
jgi:hypothetical protein